MEKGQQMLQIFKNYVCRTSLKLFRRRPTSPPPQQHDEQHGQQEEDHELEFVRKIICNVELMSEDVALLSEGDKHDFLVDPNLFDRLEVEESSTDGHLPYGLKDSCCNSAFGKVQGSWHNRKLIFYCVKECLCSRYSSRYKGGYRTWIKSPAWVTSDELAKDVFEEIQSPFQ
jgi:hypothetical protein